MTTGIDQADSVSRPRRQPIAGGGPFGLPRMRGDERQRRRGHALDAAGLSQADGTNGDELLLDLVGQAREARIIEVGRQGRRIVAAIAGDVLGLAIEINRVFRVGFEPANKMSGDIAKLRPDARKNSERKLGLRRELES